MRILIYGQDGHAKDLQASLNAAGVLVSLRDPHTGHWTDAEAEVCDEVYTDGRAIAETYEARGVTVKPLTKAKTAETKPAKTVSPKVEKTKKR